MRASNEVRSAWLVSISEGHCFLRLLDRLEDHGSLEDLQTSTTPSRNFDQTPVRMAVFDGSKPFESCCVAASRDGQAS